MWAVCISVSSLPKLAGSHGNQALVPFFVQGLIGRNKVRAAHNHMVPDGRGVVCSPGQFFSERTVSRPPLGGNYRTFGNGAGKIFHKCA
jgi:hypothetical protein